MRPLRTLLIALICGVAPLHAQGRGGFGGGGGRGGMGGPGMMRGRRPTELPSEDLLRGPYEPDSMARKFQLDSVQSMQYRTAWDSMMAQTRPARDSVFEVMGTFRRARTEGYQREGERDQGVVERLGKHLKKEEGKFDKVIRRFLTREQWEDFKDWRKRRRETEQELRQQRMREGGLGPDGGPGRRGGH